MWLVFAVVCFGAMVMSRGRAGILVGSVVIALWLWNRSRRGAIALFTVVLLAIIAFPWFIQQTFVYNPERVAAAAGLQQYDRLTAGRIGRYFVALELVRRNPVFGAGLGTYGDASEAVNLSELDRVEGSTAHNLYLQVASESGIIAALAVTLFMVWALGRGLRAYRAHPNSAVVFTFCGVIAAQFATSLVEVEVFWTVMRAFPFWIALAGLVRFYPPVAE
jgi:O-antigen ligase